MPRPLSPEDVADKHGISPKRITKLLDRYRVTDGATFSLMDYDPSDTASFDIEKAEARVLLQGGIETLIANQERLYAQDRWALLCCFQAMDAAGKDSAIKHVMSGVNPQGVQVTSFKAPGPEDLSHDFLWRIHRVLPERGRIGIFNRSHYEEVLVVRVHPELLRRQRLPDELITDHIWKERLEAIAAFERYLARQGIVILKFFLNVSRDEQKRRFLKRLDEPEKNWKFDAGDLKERSYWERYMQAYQDAISATAAPHAPWFVVPADNKWFTRLVVVAAVNQALTGLDLRFPEVSSQARAELDEARRELEKER
ncbi:MAG: polyphosphate kinase 2 family protein [Acetobacteraceae bacterium]|nr:polyphosphate kinase 2 family protein [Acetobacteraceae bacterium]MBV8577321.1 polyphosphate kinase 2 family protein [Acetobacteraceae bacterium]